MNRVEVLLPRPFDHGFDYLVPDGMQPEAGSYVSVPFGRSTLIGVVWGAGTQTIAESKCKPLQAVYTQIPPMPAAMRQFIDRTAAYTMAEKGLVLKMAMPMAKAITHPPMQTIYHLADDAGGKSTTERQKITDALRHSPLPRAALLAQSGASAAVITGMVKAGMIRASEQVCAPPPQAFTFLPAPPLRGEQREAADALTEKMTAGFSVTLLDGVTGSGKTEVYFDVIERLLKEVSGQVLVLLPEIALSTQWISRCEARFGTRPLVWHSSISEAQRRAGWQAIASGAARLVVGARSALYLPYHDLKWLVVDEEHEASYKQEEGVLYHARDMAVLRAACEKTPLLLVSATPSIETVSNVAAGKYIELKLSDRHGAFDFPDVALIDLRQDKPERGCFIAPTLRKAMIDTLAAGHQVMLFLNRRGYAPLVLCRHCGHRFQCPNCSAWMVQHNKPPRLQCHHCDCRIPIPERCPSCDEEGQMVPCGPGVERLEEEVRSLFPNARTLSLTSDDGDLSESILQVIDHGADIIIGTQLLAKGHHFPHLALVGVVDADLGLSGGDLRASERTYQLLHQLAGRAGRQEAEGKVYLQTMQPEHPVLQALAAGDRDGFVALELDQRKQALWPPYGRLAALLFDGANETQVMQIARQVARAAPSYDGVRILGPAPAPLSKLRNQYRFRIIIKTPKEVHLQQVLKDWLAPLKLPTAVRLKVDVDPYSFL